MSEQEIPWDDLRTILAIARAGSLSGAARELKVSHATVFRRLGHIEERLGVKLFERGRGGYAPSPAGEEIADAATRIEAEVIGVERRVIGRDLRPAGTVRVATTDTLLIGLLSPVFAAFREAYPDIALEVSVSNAVVNLSRREADVAIRPTTAPPEHLIGRRLVTIEQAVYGRAGDFRKGIRCRRPTQRPGSDPTRAWCIASSTPGWPPMGPMRTAATGPIRCSGCMRRSGRPSVRP
jgi:molybdate transport repressor ModE-like protein